MNISKMLKSFRYELGKHSPEILTGIGIAGMITTTVMAVRATPKALDLLAEVKENTEGEDKKTVAKEILIILFFLSSLILIQDAINPKTNIKKNTPYITSLL